MHQTNRLFTAIGPLKEFKVRKLVLGLVLIAITSVASASLEEIFNCSPVIPEKSFVKKVVVQKLKDKSLSVQIQSVYSDKLVEFPILKTLSAGDEYSKLILESKPGSTMSLVLLQSGHIERATIMYEGPKAPQGSDFGAAVEFLDCN